MLQLTRTYPLCCPVAWSMVFSAFQRAVTGTQWGGYLNRATSNIRTISLSAWYPPRGEKCPIPVYYPTKWQFFTISIPCLSIKDLK
jgi:hypothetical protein